MPIISGSMDDWRGAVCRTGTLMTGSGLPFTNSSIRDACYSVVGNELLTINVWPSDYLMKNDLTMQAVPQYASTGLTDGTYVAFSRSLGAGGAVLSPLTAFGFHITTPRPPVVARRTYEAPRSAAPLPAPQVLPSPVQAQPPLADADAQGFTSYPDARCNYSNLAVALGRTAQSLVVICQTGVGRLYYRGFGLQNGLALELDDPIRQGSGFVATNRVSGVEYSVFSDALTINTDSEVLSREPMLEYWSQ